MKTFFSELFLTRKNLFSLQGILFSLQGWVCSEFWAVGAADFFLQILLGMLFLKVFFYIFMGNKNYY